jgi:diguanylate cyclase (GGDEF)-like protein/PAS domain S-box-containing protein
MSVYESTSNGVLIVDTRNTIIAINPAFTRITGYEAGDVIGNRPNILNSGRQNKSFYKAMWQALNTQGIWEGEIWNRRKNGDIYPEWLNIAAIRDDTGAAQYYVGTFSDISAFKTSEDKLIQLAFYDPLTSLPNRNLFQDRLNHTLTQACREEGRFALCFIDLDGFKEINDNYGHLIGDAVLLETARRLKACVRASDTVARLAGDEFTIIADKADNITGIAAVAKKIMDTMAEDFNIDGHKISCGVSIGIAVYPESGTDAETLLNSADTAMYEVKKTGKNGFRFHALPVSQQNRHPALNRKSITGTSPYNMPLSSRAVRK